jgi:hypothetical protein
MRYTLFANRPNQVYQHADPVEQADATETERAATLMPTPPPFRSLQVVHAHFKYAMRCVSLPLSLSRSPYDLYDVHTRIEVCIDMCNMDFCYSFVCFPL